MTIRLRYLDLAHHEDYRLSDNLNNTVAVIEAGSYYEFANGNQSQVPGYDNNNAGTPPGRYNPLIDWNFNTTNQAVCRHLSSSLALCNQSTPAIPGGGPHCSLRSLLTLVERLTNSPSSLTTPAPTTREAKH